MNLLELMAAGTKMALALIIREKNLFPADYNKLAEALTDAIYAEYQEVLALDEGLLAMGPAMQKHYLNVACQSAAVKALKEVGLI